MVLLSLPSCVHVQYMYLVQSIPYLEPVMQCSQSESIVCAAVSIHMGATTMLSGKGTFPYHFQQLVGQPGLMVGPEAGSGLATTEAILPYKNNFLLLLNYKIQF